MDAAGHVVSAFMGEQDGENARHESRTTGAAGPVDGDRCEQKKDYTEVRSTARV